MRFVKKLNLPNPPMTLQEVEMHLRELEREGYVYQDKQGRWWPTANRGPYQPTSKKG
jgi:DNA-binding transcriptional ArsR family regulator